VRDRPYLIVLSGNDVGQMHKIAGAECVVGRASTANIRLTDDGVSRQHARITVVNNVVTIEDLNSVNGLFVNGVRVKTATIKDGDQIQLGGTTILKFTYHDSLEEEFQRKMYDAALRDPLTKAFNKKYLLDRLATEVAYAKRHGSPLALLMLDIDFFKKVNDTYGHLAGDTVLVRVAQLAQANIRAEDVFARYGGEEFVVMARATTTRDAVILAERLRAQVASTPVPFEGKSIVVTVSIGIAALPDAPAQDAEQLLAMADEALYEAKRGGRNRVVRR
jgi:diguanylate cyclase (GGDEF)-like protein